MSTLNIIIVVTIFVILFGWGIWFTKSKFENIEEDTTERRKDIEEDTQVE